MTKLALPKPDRFERTEKRIDYTSLRHPKVQPVRDARLREFVRRRGCSIRGLHGHKCGPRIGWRLAIDFAHIGKLGVSIKSSDHRGIGLCHDAHREQTAMNWKQFAKKYGIDPDAIAEGFVAEYAARIPKGRR